MRFGSAWELVRGEMVPDMGREGHLLQAIFNEEGQLREMFPVPTSDFGSIMFTVGRQKTHLRKRMDGDQFR